MDFQSVLSSIRSLPDSQYDAAMAHLEKKFVDVESFYISTKLSHTLSPHTLCLTHKEKLIGFCVDCNQPVCKVCENCVNNHNVKPLAEMIKETFPSPPNAKQMAALALAASKHLPNALKATIFTERTSLEKERAMKACVECMELAPRFRTEDVAELDRLREIVSAALERMHTNAGKKAVADAADRLDAAALIDLELAACSEEYEKAKIELARARATACRLRGELGRLEFASKQPVFPPSQAERGVLAYVADALARAQAGPAAHELARPALPLITEPLAAAPRKKYGMSPTVQAFVAFDGVLDMEGIDAALDAPLTERNGIQFGLPVLLPEIPQMSNLFTLASLSACGVLCSSDYTTRSLTVCDLRAGRTVRLLGGKWMFGVVFDGTLFVSWSKQTVMHYAPLADVFAGRDIRAFEEFPLVGPCHAAPRLDSAPRGWIAVCNHRNKAQHIFINLAARTSHFVDVGEKTPTLGGFTGIAMPGNSWACCDWGDNVLLVSEGGRAAKISGGLHLNPTVLPSAARPADLSGAAVFDCNCNFNHRNAVRKAPRRHRLAGHQALLRLHADLFMFLQKRTGKWCAMRIVVP
eukprot:gnl/Chilomastix_cuspidata/3573.p1 GENE.gnl/Chilomastix_cuspidata/3573~~gnl/Chilomastix_cuspidata/3573.p1  ORF type:complete len:583 (+),score=165.28 gnl/Chilomastix_cuspidata/3573:56-1804(+)